MLKVEEDRLLIITGESSIRFNPTGGPDDPIEIMVGPQFGCLMERHEIERFQKAWINFLSTGFFDQEPLKQKGIS